MRTKTVVPLRTCLIALLWLGAGSSAAQNTYLAMSVLDMGFGTMNTSTSAVRSVVGQPFLGSTGGSGLQALSGFLIGADYLTIVGEQDQLPLVFSLYQNYPNPFNPSTTIAFDLPHASHVTLKVYNILGQEVGTVVNELKDAGRWKVHFDAQNLGSGAYFYRISAGSFVKTHKMIILR